MTRRITFALGSETTEVHCMDCRARVIDMCMAYDIRMHRDHFMGPHRHSECRAAEVKEVGDVE